jgi:hypothetical protein
MKHPVGIVAAMLALLITAGVSIASAQDAVTIDTTFAFRVGTVVCQPGRYELRTNVDLNTIMVTAAKGTGTPAVVLTRLAEPDPAAAEGKVVFDKVGDMYYLSEVWMPGSDGFLLTATKEKHTHVKVKATKK